MARNGYANGHASLKQTAAVLAKAKWTASGLQDSTARKLGLRPVESASTLHPNFQPVAAVQIPYFNFDGERTKFYRVRYLAPLPGFAGQVAKPQRYAQAPGTLNEVYMPPVLDRVWGEIAADPETVLYITEGEFKAAAACARGLPCLGLGGVDVWRSGKRGLELLPQLVKMRWEQRHVFIIFDSDASQKPQVMRAQIALARELTARGATPWLFALPDGEDGRKQGLDDFIVAAERDNLDAVEQIQELQTTSKPFGEASALWEMNSEVVYVRDPGLVVVQKSHQRLGASAFTDHAFSNRHYTVEVVNSRTDEVRYEQKPLAPAWLKWPQRFELQRLDYSPGEQRITDDGNWNLWQGWGTEPKRGDVKLWSQLLSYITQDEGPEARRWLEQWFAYPVQHPGTKLFTAVAVWGKTQGTGKSMLGYSVLPIYGRNGTEIKEQDLKASFNEWAQCRQFVMGDDVTGGDSREYADALKGAITQKTLRINAKYVPTYEVTNRVNYYFTSNQPDSFFMEDDDRRFFILEAGHAPLARAFYDAYDFWLHGEDVKRGIREFKGEGPPALFDHLLRVDLTGFKPQAPALETKAKRAMIVDNKSDLAMFCHKLKFDPQGMMRGLGERASKEAALVSSEQLLRCYDPQHATKVTANGLGRELKRAGFRQAYSGEPVQTTAGAVRLYIVREQERWTKANHTDCSNHWNRMFGPRGSGAPKEKF